MRKFGCWSAMGMDVQTFSLVLTIWADLHDDDKWVTLAASYMISFNAVKENKQADLDFDPVHFPLYILLIPPPSPSFPILPSHLTFHLSIPFSFIPEISCPDFRGPQALGYEFYSS